MANAPSDAIERLIDVVAQLRDPTTGCPWDLEQTHTSLVPYVLEEAHEVADAIRQGDDQHLKEELGDLRQRVLGPREEPVDDTIRNEAREASTAESELVARRRHG